MGQFSYVYFLGFCTFCRFWPFLGIVCIFGVSGGVGGVLGVLLGYKTTRGIKLVVRGSIIGFWKVWVFFEGVWGCFGGSGWVKGGLLDPCRMLFAPLDSYMAPELVPNTT